MSSITARQPRRFRRREIRLICYDLTCNTEQNCDENSFNQYELSDVNDSCEITFNDELIQFNVQQLEPIKVLGRGTYSVVILSKLEHRADVVLACKKIASETLDGSRYSVNCDLKAMRTVANDRHPHIAHFYGALFDRVNGELILCMEPIDASLDKIYPILHSTIRPDVSLLDLFIWRLTKHIVLALDYLKSKKLIHRNMRSNHILVGRQLKFKLCGFETDESLPKMDCMCHRDSVLYLPPECIENSSSYGTRSSMWSLGMILLETSRGHHPLQAESLFSAFFKIKNGWQSDIPITLPQATRDLLSKLLAYDVNQRPNDYSEILLMESITNIEDKPTEDEIILINKLIDLLPEEET